jgi:hypothetical protein
MRSITIACVRGACEATFRPLSRHDAQLDIKRSGHSLESAALIRRPLDCGAHAPPRKSQGLEYRQRDSSITRCCSGTWPIR